MASDKKRQPPPAYDTAGNPKLEGERQFYEAVAATAKNPNGRHLKESFIVPIRSGRAWTVAAGQVCRIITPEGRQVGDFNIWNKHNPRERFWAARTRQLQGSHVSTFDRLWSCLPYLRPLLTITADSLAKYGIDEDGARIHDLLGTRCDPYINMKLTGVEYNNHCHSNLTRAVLPHGLAESDVHDVLNVFQVTGLNQDGKYFMKPSPAKPGDYFEFFAEIDLLCAISTCPYGDLSVWEWDSVDSQKMIDCCHPLEIQVFSITDDDILSDWKRPDEKEEPSYKGMHGLQYK